MYLAQAQAIQEHVFELPMVLVAIDSYKLPTRVWRGVVKIRHMHVLEPTRYHMYEIIPYK